MSLSNLFKCTIEGDSSWFHLMVGTPNQLVSLKVRVGRPNGARAGYLSGTTGQVDSTGVRRAWNLFVAEGYSVVRKLSSSEQTRDKVRRRFTLLVTARAWWDDRAGIDVTGGPGCRRCPRLIQ